MRKGLDRRQFLRLLLTSSAAPLLGSAHHESSQGQEVSEDLQQPNVIILVFDALSARHMSLYGYARPTTPNLAEFAQKATVYHTHRAAGNFTTPGTASLLTGTYPWQHRALNASGVVRVGFEERNLFRLAPHGHQRIYYTQNPWASLLLNQFRQDGDLYVPVQTGGLADYGLPLGALFNDSDAAYRAVNNQLFGGVAGLEEVPGSLFLGLANELRLRLGAEGLKAELADTYPRGVPMQRRHLFFLVEEVIDAVMDLLGKAHRPFLAYLHLWPPHNPYYPRREFTGIFDNAWEPPEKKPHPSFSKDMPQRVLNQLHTAYDEYIANLDAEFGRLYRFLADRGLLKNTYLVITSDHGELFERGVRGHVTELLYEPVIHIPLLIARPGQEEREDVYAPTSCIDLLPTLLQALSQPIPAWSDGELLPAMGGTAEPERPIYALEAKRNAAHERLHVGTMALIRERYKLIHYFGYSRVEDYSELYDLRNDPEELEDLSPVKPSLTADLEHELQAKLAEINSVEPRHGAGPTLRSDSG